MVKAIVLALFAFIFYALGSSLYYMMKDGPGSKRMFKALAMRVGASIVLFGFIMLAFKMGWIQPDTVKF